MVDITLNTPVCQEPGKLYSQAVHVPDRPTDDLREAGLVGSPSHETLTMASEVKLACARESGEDHSIAQVSPSTSRLVVNREQCTAGPTVASLSTGKFNNKLNFYKLISYVVDQCICPALCRSRQTLEKNVLSWALAGTSSVLFTRQGAIQPTCRYTVLPKRSSSFCRLP